MNEQPTIMYTQTDEAPALATRSWLPIIRSFLAEADVAVVLRDISLAGRIIQGFSDRLPPEQQAEDALQALGELAKTREANIIKLPNISASVPQLKRAIAELQEKGYAVPAYPEEPQTDDERAVKARYDKIKGSAVNPVLREGNSDRRAPKAVKEHARAHPPRMGAWSSSSKSHVATMSSGDFRSNEKSVTVEKATKVRVEHVDRQGAVTVLKDSIPLLDQEILDASVMQKEALVAFIEEALQESKKTGLLFSLHLKATMMKVSDPIIFGHVVRTFFQALFQKHGARLDALGFDANNGLADLESKLKGLDKETQEAIEADLRVAYEAGPALAMVNSDKGITNLHVPSDVIIDASMPPMIRDSGKMWNAAGELQDTKAVIPDSSYAGIYQSVIDDCKEHGALDPATIGTVSNVGLMAKKAEEYGSHDKTFEVAKDGQIRIVDEAGTTLMSHEVAKGDIWRACQTKDEAVKDWVQLAVRRARAEMVPAVFWLDLDRAHDSELIKKVVVYLKEHDTRDLSFYTLAPPKAAHFCLERMRKGENTISVTGNVLRDYLTDLFPILEVGTSAKMLSIVPLMNGGGLFETGAGGSAPKHVQQFEKEGHLRWDSLGEFLALAASLEHLDERRHNPRARFLGQALEEACTQYLMSNKSPSRKVHELDNRGSHFYLALYWAQALAAQDKHPALKAHFEKVAKTLAENEPQIVEELRASEGKPVALGGYFRPDDKLADAAMRPSATLNRIIDG